ncbi:MAG: YggS family pyridoxal phosphate-dependent enzyme [Candidatus Omnitrophica bacterium]|nr:YggS family pyridoxal phosphate-dependent enzyme [Candidatus Omnitrophota bacterium]
MLRYGGMAVCANEGGPRRPSALPGGRREAAAGFQGTKAVKPWSSMIQDNVRAIRDRISSACFRMGKDPGSVTVIAVGKERSVEDVREAVEAGICDIGENRVQEAVLKKKRFLSLRAANYEPRTVRWHLVGHLQTNKVKQAVSIFDLIHSIDSVKLAAAIDKEAAKAGKIQDILIQVNTSFEETKSGIRPDEIIPVFLEVARLRNVRFKGLMTIAPFTDNPEKVRLYFRKLKQLLDEVNAVPAGRQAGPDAPRILAMGMSDDFEVAVEEGATMVRIGRGIFG